MDNSSSHLTIHISRLTIYDRPKHRLKEALNPFRKKYHRDFWALKDVSLEGKI